MAYQGYLIKVGNYIIPHDFIALEKYKVTMNGQDVNSYRDADGDLHRTALNNQMWKIEFETKNLLTNEEFTAVMAEIQKNYIDATEKSVIVTAYSPEHDYYITQKMYMPDISFDVHFANDKEIKYNSVRMAFIGSKKAVKNA